MSFHCERSVVAVSKFDLLVGHVSGGFGICVMSVSPTILKQREKGVRTLRGIGFLNMSRLFGDETIALLQRTGRPRITPSSSNSSKSRPASRSKKFHLVLCPEFVG